MQSLQPNQHLKQNTIILASGSIGRKNILQRSQLTFSIVPSQLNETAIKNSLQNESPAHIATQLAQQKALLVSKRHPHAFVIGADQLCEFNGTIFDKPGNPMAAFNQLSTLSGHTHQLHTAVCLAHNNTLLWQHADCALLTMRKLSDDEINTYLELDQPFHCCGSYQIESLGCHLFKEVQGSSDTIQGLPLVPLLTALREHQAYQLHHS